MKFTELAKFFLTVLLMGASVALAVFDPVNDDTDIFLANPTITAERPNVLIILDNTANWNTPFDNEKTALVSVVNGLTDQYNVGLMMFPETGGGNDAVDGGYVRYHVRQMTPTNKLALSTMVGALDQTADKGNNNTLGLAMYEAYLYFSGKTSVASHGKVKTDKDGTTDPLLSPLTGHALPAGTSPGLYRSPIADGCAKNFIIFISNGPANENASARSFTEGKLATLTGVSPPTTIAISPSGQQANWGDEMAKFMANADVFATSGGVPNSSSVQNVYSYTVEVDPDAGANIINVTTSTAHGLSVNSPVTIAGTARFDGTHGVNTIVSTTKFTILHTISPNPATEAIGTVNSTLNISEISQTSSDITALLKSVAANGKGKYFGVSSGASGTGIVDAMNAIFTEVQAVNSVFASTTLPVSVNVRGTNLNQVYIGVFRPDATKSPRWLGNLKMYNLGLDTTVVGRPRVFLADATAGPPPATGAEAENTTTGFISQNAVSFWTVSSTFWNFRDPSLNGPGGVSDRADGDLVEKGGAAQQLRIAFAAGEASNPLRNLYTCTTGLVGATAQTCAANSLLSDTPFNTANAAISAAALNLDSRQVAPLTAFATKAITALTDRRTAVLNNSNPATSVAISSLANSATTKTMTSLTTATPKTISTLTSDVANTGSIGISTIVKTGGNFVVTASGTLPSQFANTVSGVPTVTITGASNTYYNATWNISAKTATTFQINGSGNPGSSTGGTAAATNGVVVSSTATATLTGHGYTSTQTLTIAGATPGEYNKAPTLGITVTGANTFTYPVSTPSATGNATGTITASGNTTTATATFALAHGFTHGSSVIISGASDGNYNGAQTISCTGSDCTGKTTFTYCVGGATLVSGVCTGGTAVVPNTASPVYAVSGGSTTVTATTAAAHGFLDGSSVLISNSNIAGYNGTFTIACTAAPACAGATTFTYTTASVLPANTSTTVTAAGSGATIATVTATVVNHGFAAGDSVVIESTGADTVHPGTYTVLAVPAPTADTFAYTTFLPDNVTPEQRVAPTGTFTARPTLANLRAIATVVNHGYTVTQKIYVSNALPTAYNTVITAGTPNTEVTRVLDASNFEYKWAPTLGAVPGANSSTGASVSIKTLVARATSVNHGFADASGVTIVNATALDSITPTAFNRTNVTITRIDANTFTYPILTAEGAASGAITASPVSGGSGGERDLIIRWVRGEDNFENENTPANTSTSDIRASVHGDVLHSRPAVINYNRFAASDDDVFVYYGGNDGVFHAVKGGYANPSGFTPTGLTPGMEAWGFVPSEFFNKFKRLRNNAPQISSSFKREYFMDGPIGVLTEDNCCLADASAGPNGKLGDTGDRVNLYIANRRGGRFLYALDVNNPVAPKFLWKISNATTNFSELGQSWSQPVVVPAMSGISVPVLVFGAGYDEAVDDVDPAFINSIASNGDVCLDASCTIGTPTSRRERSMGRGIYVVNAYTGALIWRALGAGTAAGNTKIVSGMNYAIPSDITVIRNETNGIVNRAYVGDTGGNLWRIDFKHDTSGPAVAADPNNLALTTVTKLAAIADQSTAAGRRKFQFPPDVVGQVGFDAILIGSGDREHPFDTTVANRFYMFKDKGNDTAPLTGTTTCDPTILEGPIPDATDACPPVANGALTPPETGDIPGMANLTSNCIQDVSACVAVGSETQVQAQARITARLGTDRGWYITLNAGEKVVGNAISIGGTTFFNTNQPSATAGGGACGSNLGIARQYQVATADATSTTDLNAVGGLTGEDRSLVHAGGGYLPSPVHVVVMLGGQPVEAVISGVQVSTPAGVTLSSRLRKFWYKEVDPR